MNCLYTSQGEYLCRAQPKTDMTYGRNILEGFATAGTSMTNMQIQKYAAMLKDGCYNNTNNTFVEGVRCDQAIANVAVDKCGKGSVCSLDKSRAKGAMKACPDDVVSGVSKAKEIIKQNMPVLSPDMFVFDAKGKVIGIKNGPEVTAKLNTVFQC